MARKIKSPASSAQARKSARSRKLQPIAKAAQETAPSPERTNVLETLRQRAVALARPRTVTEDVEQVQVISFEWGRQRWGVDSDDVEEVIPLTTMTPLPGLPSTYLGLIHYRGEVYSVIDIACLIGIGSAPEEPTHAILVKHDGAAIAIAATRLEGTAKLDVASIAPMSPDHTNHPALRGLSPDLAILFDPRRLLEDSRLVVNDQPDVTGIKETAD